MVFKNSKAFLTIACFLFLSLTLRAGAETPSSCHSAHQNKYSSEQIIKTLRSIEPIVDHEIYRQDTKLSQQSIDYIRMASGIKDLTANQAEQLYQNNLLLLASRAKKEANELTLKQLLKDDLSVASEVEQISQELSQNWDVQIEISSNHFRAALKVAVENTKAESFSKKDIARIVQIYSIKQESSRLYEMEEAWKESHSEYAEAIYESRLRGKRKPIEPLFLREISQKIERLDSLKQKISNELSPEIRSSLGVKSVSKTDKCCGANCMLCPLSMGLKNQISGQGLGRLNAHLKELPDSPPPREMKLFELIRLLKQTLPGVNW